MRFPSLAAVAAFLACAPAEAGIQTFYFSSHDDTTKRQAVGSLSYDDAAAPNLHLR